MEPMTAGRDGVALIDAPAFSARGLGAVMWEHEGRTVIFRDAQEALARTPDVRPSVLVVPDSIAQLRPSEVAMRVRQSMGADAPRLVLVHDPKRRLSDEERTSFDACYPGPLSPRSFAHLFDLAREVADA